MSPTAHHSRRPILVAIGASGGLTALRMAHRLAARDSSEALVVSVIEPPPIYDFEPRRALLVPSIVDEQILERRQSVHDRLHRVDWTMDHGGEPDVEIPYGDPGHEIAAVARAREARLVVVGIGPHSVARRLITSGTAWAACRRAPCPVLAVSERARDIPRIAVIAIDFSPDSINAAREALAFIADGGVVHLVHAWSRIETAMPLAELTAMNDAYAASIPERFDRVRTELGRDRSLTFHTVAMNGKPAEVVLGIARAQHADLVVAGTHGYGMLERWMLGSVSTALLRGAESSVLLVPAPPATEQARLLRHMTGTSVVRSPEHWDAELQDFVRRNHDRRTALEIDDRNIGAQVQETGYSLVGASYDPHDHHVALMFGAAENASAHLTRSLGHVRSVAVASGPRDEDRALFIESEYGSALLTFLDHATANMSPAGV